MPAVMYKGYMKHILYVWVDIHRRDLVRIDRGKNYVNFVHLNLCIALASGLLVFMAGIQGGAGSTVSCVVGQTDIV